MLWARRPARIYERVVEPLLDVVNNMLLKVGWIIGEESDPSHRFLDGWLLTASDSFNEIMQNESKHTIRGSFGNLLFPTPSSDVARRTVRYAVTCQDVPPAEDPMTHDAETAPSVERQLIATLRTGTASVTLPHV